MRISAKLHTEGERLHADFQATVQVGGGLSLGHALMWDKQGRLAVQVADEAEAGAFHRRYYPARTVRRQSI